MARRVVCVRFVGGVFGELRCVAELSLLFLFGLQLKQKITYCHAVAYNKVFCSTKKLI